MEGPIQQNKICHCNYFPIYWCPCCVEMTASDGGNCKVKLERKEKNFQDLKKADGRRCFCIIFIYSFIVQSANIKTNVTGKDIVCVSGVERCAGCSGGWGTGARWMLSLLFGYWPPCLRLPAVGRCPPAASTTPASLDGCHGWGSGGQCVGNRRDGAGEMATTEQHPYRHSRKCV